MASENWRNNKYGTLQNSGKERAIDYGGSPDYFAPVRAVILIDENENILGSTDSRMYITGGVNILDDLDNIIGIRGSPVFVTGGVTDEWVINALDDELPADSDKTFTVPADREYQVLSIHIDYFAFADVATRQVQVDFRDTDDNVFGEVRMGATQTASTTGHYMVAPAMADLMGFRDTNYLMTPMPSTVFLQPSEDIRVYDNQLTANDTMTVRIRVAERAV